VTRVAMDCGFFHLGRFARDYRQAFGESPSVTLGGRRGISSGGYPRSADPAS
jgi:transcriptional regulator GlxA family with amidase domain